MSTTRRIAFAVLAAWISRGITVLLGLLLMPVLFRHLAREELGVWLLMSQTSAMFGILDLGFGITLTRRIAFAKGRDGNLPAHLNSWPDEIATLAAIGRRVYRALACLAFIIPAAGGFVYLRGLELTSVSLASAWIAWLVLCISQAFNMWAGVYSCLLQGTGYVGWDSLIASFTNALMLGAQIAVVLFGGGILTLASIAAVAALGQRLVLFQWARGKNPHLFRISGEWNGAVFRSMVPFAVRAWLTTLGFALVGQTDQFFIAQFKGTTEIPAYRAAFVICVNFNIVAVTFAQASSVFISQLWQAGKLVEVHRVVLRNMRLALLIMGCSAGLLLAGGEGLFNLWLGVGNFIGYPILALFCMWQFLEVQAFAFSLCSRATEDEAFAFSTLGGGVLKLLLAGALTRWFGLLGLASASLIAMLCTNYWYAVWRSLRRLQIPFILYLKTCLFPVLFIAAACYAVGRGIVIGAISTSPIVSLSVIAGLIAGIFSMAVWFFVVEAHQKFRIAQGLRRFARWT